MEKTVSRRMPILIVGGLVMTLLLGLGIWQVITNAGSESPETAAPVVEPTELRDDTKDNNDPLARSLGLPPANPAAGDDVGANATPGATGATRSETVARVFSARFSVSAQSGNTTEQTWIDSWAPIASPSIVGSGSTYYRTYHKYWRDAQKTMSPAIKSAQRVWAGSMPSGPSELWRVTVVRNLVSMDKPQPSPILETLAWDVVVSTSAPNQITEVWTADPKRTAPPRED